MDGAILPPLQAFGNPEGEFGAPRGLCAGPGGVFVADTINGIVQRFTAAGRFVNVFDTARNPGEYSRPIAVQDLGDGTVVVADYGDRVGLRRFEVSGKFLGDVPSAEQVVDPVALSCDEEGRMYVLDRDGERVQRLHADLTYDEQILDLAEYLHDS